MTMWKTYSAGQTVDGETSEILLAGTTALFDRRGDQDAVALLIDVRSIAIACTDEEIPGYVDETNWHHDAEAVRILLLEVDADQFSRYKGNVMSRIETTMLDVFRRRLSDLPDRDLDRTGHTVKYVAAREHLPAVDPVWRETLAAALAWDETTNQARRDRTAPHRPAQDGLTFASEAEMTVYRMLTELQAACREDRTFAVLPLPGARLRAGHTWTPDIVLLGGGKALIFEIDGPHHRASRRLADDHNRDLQWRRCGIPVVRLPVEDVADPDLLEKRVKEELRRVLFPGSPNA